MKASPLQQVHEKFGSREKLVEKIIPLLETGDTDDAKSALMGTTNKKLLRIYETAIQVKEHGGRKNLIEKLTTLRYPKGNPDDGFLKSAEEATQKRLLEMYRQAGGDMTRPASGK
ncbi:MAG: hypothetical protein VX223_13530 [Myxococcota bacterium]|nr:hypothetical protein [Myxococcota bacterium]